MTSSSLNELIDLFSKLPSLGPRSARRAVLYLLKRKKIIPRLVDSLKEVQANTKFCSTCANLDIIDPCAICRNEKRKKDKICVIEDISDLWAIEKSNALPKEELEILKKAANAKKSGKFGNMSLGQIAKLYGLGTLAGGFLIDKTSDQSDVGLPADTMPEGQVKQGIVNPILKRAQGGVMDLQDGGESKGPGTGTSDSIPAMLSDGEFVMTAKAVRGAGGGDRREGARKMYEAMDRLEARA